MEKLSSIKEIINLNTELFRNSGSGISEGEAKKTFSDSTNSFNFIYGHIIGTRYFMASLIGNKSEFEYDNLYNGREKPFDPNEYYPETINLKNSFEIITLELFNRIDTVSNEVLESALPFEFPIVSDSILAGLAFLAEHESYHIGQLGFIRKLLGKTAISYRK